MYKIYLNVKLKVSDYLKNLVKDVNKKKLPSPFNFRFRQTFHIPFFIATNKYKV